MTPLWRRLLSSRHPPRSSSITGCCRYLHQLSLTNTYTREKTPVILSDGEPVFIGPQPTLGNDQQRQKRRVARVYCCGPTVYDDCHLGHAFTYIRFDLFRRILTLFSNIDLIVGMNITDIDDKIIKKSQELDVDYKMVAQKYFDTFVEDMSKINCSPPHVYLKVSENIDAVIEYIKTLEDRGFAYINEETLDVTFDNSRFPLYSESHVQQQQEPEMKSGKRNVRDFVLWKRRKEGEPSFDYESSTKETIFPGRPGWHVECSAMVHKLFGENRIDFHWGGRDLIFPHHWAESACCTAFNAKDNEIDSKLSDPTSWSTHWLHSGHLILEEEKMSKSLGNTITIREFLSKRHFNILRLMCIRSPYRILHHYKKDFLESVEHIDRDLKHLSFLVESGIRNSKTAQPISVLEDQIDSTEEAILSGLADDLDWGKGLDQVINLYKVIRSHQDKSSLSSFVRCKSVLERWFSAMGLAYNLTPTLSSRQKSSESVSTINSLSEGLIQIRSKVREQAIHLLKQENKEVGKELMSISDSTRDLLNKHGIKVVDPYSEMSKK